MWYFISTENPDHKYVILGGKVYTVGRKDCDILVTSDATVSRKHAEISMSHPEINLSSLNKLPILLLKDVSKFGTYVNNQKVSGERVLQDGDSVYFGSPKTPFMVVYEPLVVTSSCLDTASKKVTKKHLSLLGGHMINEWKHDCAMLIMSKISVTIKVICALVSQKPVVTPHYLAAYLSYLQGKAAKPVPDSHTPELAETQLDPSEVSFLPDVRRKAVFKGMTFVFLNDKQMKKLGTAIELGGGTPLLLEEGGEDAVLHAPGSVVMAMQEAELSQAGGWLKHVQEVLQSHDKHMIQDAEVGYAVLYCSTAKHCNPDYEPDKSVSKLPSQSLTQAEMFVPNTETQLRSQDQHHQLKLAASQQVINETILNPKKLKCRVSSPEPPVEVKQEPTSQNAPQMISRKRHREDEIEDEPAATPSSKKVKAEPVTPMSKPATSIMKSTAVSMKKSVSPLDNWGSDDEGLDYSAIDMTPASVSSHVTRKENRAARSGQEQCQGSKSPDTRSRSRSPATRNQSRSPATINSPKTRSRSRSPVPVIKTDTGAIKTKSNVRESENGSNLPSTLGQQSSRSPFTVPQTGEDDSDDMVFATSSKRQTEKASAKKSALFTSEQDENELPLTEVKQEVCQRDVKPAEPGPDGFLSTKHNKKLEIKNLDKDAAGDVLPSNCAVVTEVSLVVSRPQQPVSAGGACPEGHLRWRGRVVKNFKKFKKANNAGSNRLPTIIGGSDLEVHQGQKSKELDDWFKEAIQAESQTAREEERANALFDYDPGSRKRGR